MNNTKKGNYGEELAEKFLADQGYIILKKNFRFGRSGEIDIIARSGETLCFVEVKMRTNADYGDPLSSITPGKVKKIRKAAEGYLHVNKIYDQECRFDVVTIDAPQNTSPKIELMQGAF